MRLGIVACDILKKEIEFLTKNDPDFTYREYLEFALHENPPEMKRVIIEKVNSLKGQVDAIFLGYAICNSLENASTPSSARRSTRRRRRSAPGPGSAPRDGPSRGPKA